jgi:pyruvate dehydrogenase E1 component
VSDEDIAEAPFYRPADDSAELQYMRERRKALGGFVPSRQVRIEPINAPIEPIFEEFYKGTGDRKASTTMVFVRMLSQLLRNKEIGDLIESLVRAVGIYSHVGQRYEPVDMDTLLYYKEATDGQILEEGITEAGSMSSFIAAGTAYATYGVNTIPFFIFYSMFGFQRVADLIWAGADSRMRGFLLGATAGRTTLAGEGLQHQDGNSHVYSLATPNCISYDPAYAYELAVIIQDGIRRMYRDQESIFYYLTVMNEQYEMPPMPEGSREGILKGMYRFSKAPNVKAKARAQLLGSGTILNEVRAAAGLLEKYGVAADVWSVTSYNELYREAHACDRWNMLNPGATPKVPYVTQVLKDTQGVIVAASDYLKVLPASIDRWMPRHVRSLGTDGFGRSEARKELREFFEVESRYVALATLAELAQNGEIDNKVVAQALKDFGIDPNKKNPAKD